MSPEWLAIVEIQLNGFNSTLNGYWQSVKRRRPLSLLMIAA